VKRILPFIAALLIGALAFPVTETYAQGYFGSTLWVYWMRQVTVSSTGTFSFPGSVSYTGGTLTLGSTSVVGTISIPFTPTGGADTPLNIDLTGDFASADKVCLRDSTGTSAVELFCVLGTGAGTFTAGGTFGGSVATAAAGLFFWTGRSTLGSSANGLIELRNNAQTDGAIVTGIKRSVEAVTATKSPATTESGEIYSNIGDSDGATVTLPAAAANVCYTFIVEAAQDFNVTADASDTIQVGASVTAAGGTVDSATIGDSLTLCGTAAGTWVAVAQMGTGF
jgi:hypothetical protein